MLDAFSFTKKFLSDYQKMGAVVPSSRYLAQAMVKALPPLAPQQVIIELGAGTGVFTRQLLQDRPAQSIMALEIDPELARDLQSNFPQAQIVHGDAAYLSQHLSTLNTPLARVGAVLSAIPFISLPRTVGDGIFAAVAEVLPKGAVMVQVTYFSPAWRNFSVWRYFECRRIGRVWRNVPPAEVLELVRK